MGRRADIISETTLVRALGEVAAELDEAGLLTERLSRVEVVLQGVAVGRTAGWFIERPGWFRRLRGIEAGMIQIPRTSLPRLLLRLGGRRPPMRSLRDVLRHEYGHAFAHTHPGLVRRSQAFRAAFGAPYDSDTPAEGPCWGDHVTPYAATAPYEDFAETFMTYLRVRGRIGRFRGRPGVYSKLQFVRQLGISASRVGRRWSDTTTRSQY